MTDVTTETGARSIAIPSAYSGLLRSNFCPSDEQFTGIKSLIETHEEQLSTIKDEVERLKRCLLEMESRRDQTEEVLVKLHATLAPIKRLPPEIMSEIFEQCLESENSRGPLPLNVRGNEAPLLLGRVCSAWRGISHTTPRLWRNIYVNVCEGRYSEELRKDALPILKTWLAHSGGLPLNLVLVCKTERLLPGLVDLFEIIAANAHRWKTVRIRLQNSPVIYRIASRALTKCTSLSTLDVTDGGQYAYFRNGQEINLEEVAQPLVFDLRHTSHLHHLSLSLAGLAIRDIHVSWASVTRLSFMQDARSSSTSITDYLDVLRQCTSLKECAFAIDTGARDAPLQLLTLPNLESLQIQVLRNASSTTQMGDLLCALDAPRLSSLAIEDYCPRREMLLYHSPLKAFLRAHSQSIRHLRFSTTSKLFASEDLLSWISELPMLKELEYLPDEESSPKLILAALTPRVVQDSLECLLPFLERFCVYWDTTETISMVGDMIEKRYALAERGIARLKHLSCKPVNISIGYDCMPAHMLVENLAARLEPLCRCGLEVDWAAYRYDLEFLY